MNRRYHNYLPRGMIFDVMPLEELSVDKYRAMYYLSDGQWHLSVYDDCWKDRTSTTDQTLEHLQRYRAEAIGRYRGIRNLFLDFSEAVDIFETDEDEKETDIFLSATREVWLKRLSSERHQLGHDLKQADYIRKGIREMIRKIKTHQRSFK